MNESRWNSLLDRLNIAPDNTSFKALAKAYSERHRAYHTSDHIDDCLTSLDTHSDKAQNPDAIELAIWFHDAIYRPYSKSNEEDSASWARTFLTNARCQADLLETVSRLIIVTKHNEPVKTFDESLLVDIDLAILGSDTQTYAQFEKNIRQEYKTVPGFIFRKKRAQLLQGFLQREHVYHTSHFRDLYEESARQNLTMAIKTLRR